MTQLSPEAQAVLDAYTRAADAVSETDRSYMTVADAAGVAAALRAASARMMLLGYDSVNSKYLEGIEVSSDLLDQIATELEGTN